jgi:energy-coupling factor transport system ATP-binding protein
MPAKRKAMDRPVMMLRDVYHRYNAGSPIEKEVLSDINLEIKHGETVGVIGTPGSGKTTLAMIMSGLERPSSGFVDTPGPGRGKVGLVFQFPEHQLFAPSVFEDITYALKDIPDITEESIEASFERACKKVDIDPIRVKDLKPSQMSGGEQRRIAIAGILAMDPAVLIFDEPTAGLDEKGRRLILDEITRLSSDGQTIIIISHEMEDLLETTERLIFLDEGRCIEDGPVKDVLNKIAEDESRWPMLPYITEVMVRLKAKGIPVRTDIFDAGEALEEIGRVIKK